MQEWIEAQLAAGLPALAGTAVSGTIALDQQLLNELLQRWLGSTTTDAAPPIDPERIKAIVKSAAVRAEPGRVLIDFSIAI